MTVPVNSWPPLVIARNTPRAIRWRDFLLTLVMWMLFAIMLETEFKLFLGSHLNVFGLGEFDAKGNWPFFFEQLVPFLITAGILVYLLVATGVLTLRRRRRALLMPPPAPLDLATECRQARLDETSLLAARAARIVVVHIGSQGNVDLEGRRVVHH
jgi:hypothetical protein